MRYVLINNYFHTVIRDRLVGSRDRSKFDTILSSVLARDWSISDFKIDDCFYVTWAVQDKRKIFICLFINVQT